jgi:hypothetical protein
MSQQTEAHRLAAALDALLGYRGINADVGKAAAELRRLESMNAQLLEALKYLLEDYGLLPRATAETRAVVRAAIAKATGESK